MMAKSNINPYPGFDESGQFSEPRPAPRVRPEAEEYAQKHKGCIDLFNSNKHTHVIPPPPSPRCPSSSAKQNYEQSRSGKVGSLLGGGGQPPPLEPTPAPRVTACGEEIAEGHKGRSMNSLMADYGKHSPSPRPCARVKVEAEDVANLSQGGRMGSLMHDAKAMPQTPRNAPRIKPEAAESAAYGKGANMSKIMGRYGETPRSTRPVPRVKQEASDNAEQDKGKEMKGLFHNYGKQGPAPQQAPKVKNGQEMAQLDQGGRMSRLMHDGSKLPSDPKPPLRAASSAGRRNIKNNRGSISKIFSESSKWQIVPTPGVRN